MLRLFVMALSISLCGLPARSQEEDPPTGEIRDLLHQPAPCMDTESFPLIELRAASAEARSRGTGLTLRFRAEADEGWYEVEFRPASGLTFQAVLPKPLPEAARVFYYVSGGKPELRSPEYVVNVLMGGCPGARSAPAEAAERIRVRRTSPQQEVIPRGFSPESIETGGGTSGTTLGMIGGAAGGAGIAALLIAGGETASSPQNPGDPQAVRACFTPDPIPDIESGDRVLFDASCSTPASVTSYQWNFGDGTIGQGSSIEHLFRPGGTYTVTLTVRDDERTDSISRVVRVRAIPTACFLTLPDPPRIRVNQSVSFNGECSVGDRDGGGAAIVSYRWDFGDNTGIGEGVFLSHLYTRSDLYGVTLTVTNEDGLQDRTTQFVIVEGRSSETASTSAGAMTFTTELALPPGAAARVSVNREETVPAAAPSPQQVRVRGRPGENLVEGALLVESSAEGRWRFDFRSEAAFVAGSIRVDSGDVLALDAHSVVFRIAEGTGAPVRFRFRLEE